MERPATHWWQTQRHLVPVVCQSGGSLNTCSSSHLFHPYATVAELLVNEMTGSSSIHLTVASNSDLHFPIVVDHKQFRFLSRFVQSLKWNRHSLSLDMELEPQHPRPKQMHSLFTQKTVWKIDQTVKRFRWCFHKHVLVYCLALKWEFLTRLLLKSDTGSSRNLKKRKGRHVTRSRFGARLWSPLFWSQIIKEQTSEQPCFFFKFLGGRLEDRKTHMHSDTSSHRNTLSDVTSL